MPNTKKFIGKNGLQSQNIDFVSPNNSNKITVTMLDNDTLSISGDSGQLFSVLDSMSGTIFAVNDVSGIPSIEVFDTGRVQLAQYGGNVLVGTATDNATDRLQVNGSILATTLKGNLDWSFVQNKPDPVITLSGDASGSTTLTDLGNGTLSLTLANSGVTAGTYGSTSTIGTFTVDAKGRITSASSSTPSGTWGISITGNAVNVTGIVASANGGTGINNGGRTLTINTNSGTMSFTNASTTLTIANNASVSGTNTGDQTITLTGDVTGTGTGSFTTTLANSGVSAGTYNNVTVDVKGRVTGGSNVSYLTGNQSISITGDATGSGTTSIALTLANSGATAGTYRSVTVDAKGRVTSGTNPTTISGYGITDAYTKTEVDSFLQGLDPKASVRVATTANITLSGTQTIDGVAVVAGDRVLVKDQTTQSQNGVYVVSAGSWTRSTDFNSWGEIPGSFFFVEEGTINGDNGWICTSNVGGTLDTTAITFSQFSGAGQIIAGTGLAKSGNTLSISNTGVSAASYGSASQVATFTVNSQGQLTAAGSTAIAIASGAVSGLAASATTDTTNATNISSGTLNAARLPAFTGDATSTAGTSALTLANSGVTAGTYTKVTVDSKGRVTTGASLASGDLPTYTGTLTSSQVTTALGFTPSQRAAFPSSNEATVDAADLRTITNPTTGLGYAGGVRFRFSSLNDDNSSPYADVIDLSTYTDSSGGGFNALYFGKSSQILQHKYAAAGGTSWTVKTLAYTDSNITGSAATLTTARTINGTSFNGSANITTNSWGTSRTLTVGNTGKSVDGSGNVSWSLSEIGALPLIGGTLTGALSGTSAAFTGTVTWGTGNVSHGNPRSLAIGYSGSNYGQAGYGIAFTSTSDVHNYAINDIVSLWEAYDGITVRAAAGGTVGTAITWTNVLDARRSNAALLFKGNTVLASNNYNNYSPTLTGTGASGTWGINITGESRSVNLGGTGHTITSSAWAGAGGYHGYTYNGGNFRFGFSSTGGVVDVYADGNFYANEGTSLVLHAGNYSSYSVPLSGGTMTGTLSVPSQFTVRAQGGSEGGEIVLQKGPGQTGISGDVIFDTQGNVIRFFENGGSYRQFNLDLTNGNISGANGILANINGNAATVGGLSVHAGTNNEANKIVRTDGNGYIQAGYIHSANGNEGNNSSPSRVWGTNGSDSYLRTYLTSALSVGTAATVNATVTGTNATNLVYANMADNDQARIRVGGDSSNSGWLEIATADDGTEPIYVRQYTGVFGTIARTLTLLDSSGNTIIPGNLGLGITPSAWVTYRSLDLNQYGYISSGAGGWMEVMDNTYWNGTYRYKGTGFASHYLQQNGAHAWFIAPSGTAGNAITFTQAMTLDASGNLGVNTQNPQARLHIQSAAGNSADPTVLVSNGTAALRLLVSANAGNWNPLVQAGDQVLIFSGGTENTGNLVIGPWANSSRGLRIDSSGNITISGGIFTPSGAVGIVIGDDAKFADRNISNTVFLEGNQNSDRGYINFSTTNGNALGAINGGDLTWKGNAVLHAGNYTTFSNILRAVGYAGTSNTNWNDLGNNFNSIYGIVQESFNVSPGTGNSNFPGSASYKYGLLVNLAGSNTIDPRAQIYISHSGNDLIFRGGWGTASWSTWNKVLTDQNFTNYAVSLSGGGIVTGSTRFRSNLGATSGSLSDPPLQVECTGGNSAFFSFHRSGSYAVNMGLDSDNVLRIGGWSASSNRLQMDMSGNLTMAGNVTAYSDERLKKDWSDLPESFIERLAKVKCGTFTRTDENLRQVGVSAQSLQEVLPEAVLEQADGMLSVSYGNAALASVVELAKEVVELKQRVAALEALVEKLVNKE